MTDSSEFKQLVHQRMEATGEKFKEAYRALVNAASAEVVPPNHLILPRLAAKYADNPAKPQTVRAYLYREIDLQLDESELQSYVAADEDGRDDLVRGWLVDQLQDLMDAEDLIEHHQVVYDDQVQDEFVRREASSFGVTPDQYAWLEDRLTEQEFSQLSDEAMHSLLAREYTRA